MSTATSTAPVTRMSTATAMPMPMPMPIAKSGSPIQTVSRIRAPAYPPLRTGRLVAGGRPARVRLVLRPRLARPRRLRAPHPPEAPPRGLRLQTPAGPQARARLVNPQAKAQLVHRQVKARVAHHQAKARLVHHRQTLAVRGPPPPRKEALSAAAMPLRLAQ